MKALDIILIIILLFGAYRGFQKGLVVELFGLLAFILAIFVGVIMMEVGTEFLQKFINGYEKLLPYLAFLLIFILVVLTMKLLAWLLKKGLNLTPLGAVDNQSRGSAIAVPPRKQMPQRAIAIFFIKVPHCYGHHRMQCPLVNKHARLTAIRKHFPTGSF